MAWICSLTFKEDMAGRKFTVVDFFCGSGGFSEGFRQAGFQILKGYDIWNPAVETYNFNFKGKAELKDIKSYWKHDCDLESIPDSDVIVGSPPCINFSFSNKAGKGDKKEGLLLIKTFLKIIAVKKHKKNSQLKAWFMENVVNSQKHLKKRYTFEDLNLKNWAKKNGLDPKAIAISLVDCTKTLNSADYGSFQQRRRSISGECFSSRNVKWDHPYINTHKTLKDFRKIFPSPFLKRHIKFKDPNYGLIQMTHSLTDHFYDTGVPEVDWRKSKLKKINHPYMGKMSFPENENRPCRTILARNILISREAFYFKSEFKRIGDGEFRTPTLREAACLMGFPASYQFIASEASKWKLVGNAVCPTVSWHLATCILKAFKKNISKRKIISKKGKLPKGLNLNTFMRKKFEIKPRTLGRFKQHIFKDGGMTVSLTNKSVSSQSESSKWSSVAQFGISRNIEHKTFTKKNIPFLQNIIRRNFKKGSAFIHKIEGQFPVVNLSKKEKLNFDPYDYLEKAEQIIRHFTMDKPGQPIFEIKVSNHREIPLNQLLAMYAVTAIAEHLNGKS